MIETAPVEMFYDACGDWYHLKCVGLEQFPVEGEQWNCFNVSSDCRIVFLHKGAITEVILVHDLNAREFLHGDAKFSRGFVWGCQTLQGIWHGDAKINSLREFCIMGMPTSLFGGGYQKH